MHSIKKEAYMDFLLQAGVNWVLSVQSLGGWLEAKSLAQQILIAFAVSLVFLTAGIGSALRLDGYILPEEWKAAALRAGPLPDPVSIEGILTSAGSLLSLTAGVAWIAARGGYQASGAPWLFFHFNLAERPKL
jgi:hypothetical protein